MKDSAQEVAADRSGSISSSGGSAGAGKFRPLRVWPAVALVVLIVLARFGPAYLEGGLSTYWMIAVFVPFLCCVLMLIWWLVASRATWREWVFGFLGLVACLAITFA